MRDATWSYDLIAEIYATDMGRSMPFDDVGFYRQLCVSRDARARVLELGCGTGRILLDLIASGVDATGVDRSWPMLRRMREDAVNLGIQPPRVAQMDIGALALTGRFAVILAPYSLITYVTDVGVALGILEDLHALLDHGGVIVLDAFVPQQVDAYSEFREDYRRPHASGTLERAKRIESLADGTNRIERRYRLFDTKEALASEFITVETIRPYSPELIARIAGDAGFDIDGWSYDYGTCPSSAGARFATALLKRGKGGR